MNILTFDIEEWYIYELYPKGGRNYYQPVINSYLNRLLDFLEEMDTRATFFCLGIIAGTHPQIIKQIATRGHEIGCHSNKHVVLNKMTPEQFRQDTCQCLASLQDVLGKKIEMYRAPAFSINEKTKWALDILVENGIRYDCSVFPAKHQPRGLASLNGNYPFIFKTPSGNLREFPVSYSEIMGKRIVFSGGGYFRLFPYRMIHSLTTKSNYNMTYFHIRDFDSHQKRVRSLRYFQSYYGINGAFDKFSRYVEDFDFITISEASSLINWNCEIPTV